MHARFGQAAFGVRRASISTGTRLSGVQTTQSP
jgi:hypothetical protein